MPVDEATQVKSLLKITLKNCPNNNTTNKQEFDCPTLEGYVAIAIIGLAANGNFEAANKLYHYYVSIRYQKITIGCASTAGGSVDVYLLYIRRDYWN